MDITLLIGKYLESKQELRDENDSFNIVGESIHRWDFANIPCPTMEELLALQPILETELEQAKINSEALEFLNSTDYKILKYRDQVDMGITPNLTTEEYQYLLVQRQQARNSIK